MVVMDLKRRSRVYVSLEELNQAATAVHGPGPKNAGKVRHVLVQRFRNSRPMLGTSSCEFRNHKLHWKKLILVCFSNLKFARQDETPYDANFKFGSTRCCLD